MNVLGCVIGAESIMAKSLERRVGGVVTQRIANPAKISNEINAARSQDSLTNRERSGNFIGGNQ